MPSSSSTVVLPQFRHRASSGNPVVSMSMSRHPLDSYGRLSRKRPESEMLMEKNPIRSSKQDESGKIEGDMLCALTACSLVFQRADNTE